MVFADSFELSPDICTASASDIPATPGFTRMCDGVIEYASEDLGVYRGPFTRYEQIVGSWPGEPAYLGHAAIFYLDQYKFVSFAFRPDTPDAVKWSTNPSYGAGGWISVSASPGQFVNALCSQASGGSNSLIFANDGYAGAQAGCKHLNPDQIYYLNVVNANSLYTALCHSASCPMAYTPLIVH